MHLTHSRRSRRLITALAVAAASALTLAGCSSGSGSSTSGDAVTVPKTDPKATIKVLSILDLKTDNMQPVVDDSPRAVCRAHATSTTGMEGGRPALGGRREELVVRLHFRTWKVLIGIVWGQRD